MDRYTVTQTTNHYGTTVWQVVDTTRPDSPLSTVHTYAAEMTAQFAAAVLDGLPEGYHLSRQAYPARGMNRGYYWELTAGTWTSKRDESPALTPDILIRAATSHAAGAPQRAVAAAEREQAEAATRARQRYLDDLALVHGPRASQAQVDYILSLLAARERMGDGGGFMVGPTDRAGIEEMGRQEASSYIDSLREEY